jgi:hypothetical protein
MSGTGLSRVRTELRLLLPERINQGCSRREEPTLLCNQVEVSLGGTIYCFLFHKSQKSFAVAGPCPAVIISVDKDFPGRWGMMSALAEFPVSAL